MMSSAGKICDIVILNEGGFAPLAAQENFSSFHDLKVAQLLPDFLRKRLNHFGFSSIRFVDNLGQITAGANTYIAAVNILNPLIDPLLIVRMIEKLKKYPEYAKCTSSGTVPGTEADFVIRAEHWAQRDSPQLACYTLLEDTQAKYNCQLNLRKLRRIKIFKYLAEHIKGLETFTTPEIIRLLEREDIFQAIVSYCEDVRLVHLTNCPHCQGELKPVHTSVSQTMIGYVPESRPFHYQCEKCRLVVVSPHVHRDDTYKLYDFYNQEGQGQNYLVNRKSRFSVYDLAMTLIESKLPENAKGLDLGSGSGTFIFYLAEHKSQWDMLASDLATTLTYFKYPPHIKTKPLNFLKDPLGTNEYDLISTWEVVEHMEFADFEKLLDKIQTALRPGGIFVFSTPDFDSPFSQGWDFYSVNSPQHLLVFPKSWLINYFSKHPGFELIGIRNETEFLIDHTAWFKYWATTSRNFQTKSLAQLFKAMLDDPKLKQEIKQFVDQNNLGISMAVAIRKNK